MARFGSGEQPLEGGERFSLGDGDDIANQLGAIDIGAGDDSGDGNSGAGSGDDFDASIHVGRDKRNADGSYTRKRGRRSGNGNTSSGNPKKGRGNSQAGVETLSQMLLLVHLGLANATKTPELVLSEGESTTLAQSVNNVLMEFDIKPDPKITAVVGLVMAAGSIYGPKAYLIRERWKDERQQKRQEVVTY